MDKAWRIVLAVVFVVAIVAASAAAYQAAENAASQAHNNCLVQQRGRVEGNKRGKLAIAMRKWVLEFSAETRRARANKSGTSYDPHFVQVIDRITPGVENVTVKILPQVKC